METTQLNPPASEPQPGCATGKAQVSQGMGEGQKVRDRSILRVCKDDPWEGSRRELEAGDNGVEIAAGLCGRVRVVRATGLSGWLGLAGGPALRDR